VYVNGRIDFLLAINSNLYSLIISVAETEITDIYRTETTLKHWQNTEQVD